MAEFRHSVTEIQSTPKELAITRRSCANRHRFASEIRQWKGLSHPWIGMANWALVELLTMGVNLEKSRSESSGRSKRTAKCAGVSGSSWALGMSQGTRWQVDVRGRTIKSTNAGKAEIPQIQHPIPSGLLTRPKQ